MFDISHAVQMKRSSACRVMVEVFVLGLLVVVYKIPYSSIFTRGIIPTFAYVLKCCWQRLLSSCWAAGIVRKYK